jgi:cobalt-zinc-cadmium efflux system membrane fusion protein
MRRPLLVSALVALASFALVLGLRRDASAHEGEDHGDGAATASAPAGDTLVVDQAAQFALGITTAIADTQAVAETLRLQGVLAPAAGGEAVVSSPQAGRLVSARLPGVGQTVRAGQVIGTVEGSLAAPDVAGLRSDRASAEADVAQARADVTRLRALARVVAGKEVEAAEIRLRGAQARLAALAGALGAGNRYALTAPISGVVSEVTAAVGQQVEAGQPLVRIVALGRLQARGRVFEADLGRVRSAVGARATVSAEAYPDAGFRARLLALGATVDPASRTLDAVFEVENPNGALRSGQTVTVDVAVGAAESVVVVPRGALVRDESGAPAVFVHPSPEAFVRRRVVLGAETAAGVAVRSGLSPGDRVVVEGAASIR